MTKCDCYPWPDKCPYCGGQPGDPPEYGWQLVPKEPTPEMLAAATWALDRWRETHGNVQGFVPPREKYQIRWRAMLAAAPSAPCFKAAQNIAESDPVATPDCRGAETGLSFSNGTRGSEA